MPKTYPKPKLTIIILAYNEAAYIAGCLDSIALQSRPPDEVIVVDNNSKDNTAKIAGSYPFVTVINEAEQGIIPARNKGFDTAHGDLIARIDADTKLPEGWVGSVHNLMDSCADSICGISGPAYIYDLKSKNVGKLLGNVMVRQGFFRGSKLMLGHETLYGSNMIITKKAWEKVKDEACLESSKMHEDVDLALHIGKYGKIYFSDELMAGVSRRGFIEAPKKAFWRLRVWPKSVTQHRKLFTKLVK